MGYLGRLCMDQHSFQLIFLLAFPLGAALPSLQIRPESCTRALLGQNISKCNSICSKDNVTTAGSSLLQPGAICVLGAVLGTHTDARRVPAHGGTVTYRWKFISEVLDLPQTPLL